MRVAVYTLTRDRLAFTRACFARLRAAAGCPFDHLVLDNGSADGTPAWLAAERAAGRVAGVLPLATNRGLHVGQNLLWAFLRAGEPYDLVVKVDNDCWPVTEGFLARLAALYAALPPAHRSRWLLSPRVVGIARQPVRGREVLVAGERVGVTGHVGGLCLVMPWGLVAAGGWRFDERRPPGALDDSDLCAWAGARGAAVGYVEDVVVQHYLTTDGQAVAEPAYFARKRAEGA